MSTQPLRSSWADQFAGFAAEPPPEERTKSTNDILGGPVLSPADAWHYRPGPKGASIYVARRNANATVTVYHNDGRVQIHRVSSIRGRSQVILEPHAVTLRNCPEVSG